MDIRIELQSQRFNVLKRNKWIQPPIRKIYTFVTTLLAYET